MTLILPRQPDDLPGPEWETRIGLLQSLGTARSWWAARYTDGTILNEWDADPGSPNGHVDWPRIAKRGMQRVRLYCPNGHYAELGDTSDAGGRFVQFKIGMRAVYVQGAPINAQTRATLAHVIGLVDGYDGQATCYAWERLPMPDKPPGEPKKPDHTNDYYRTGRAGLFDDHLKRYWVDLIEYQSSPAYASWLVQVNAWRKNAFGRLISFRDNVNNMYYANVGKVSDDYLSSQM